MIINSFSEMMEYARKFGPVPVAVAVADDPETLSSLVEAQAEGITTAYLVGDAPAIEAIAADQGYDLTGMTIIHEVDHVMPHARSSLSFAKGRRRSSSKACSRPRICSRQCSTAIPVCATKDC